MAEDDTGAAADTGGGGGENELELAVIQGKWPDLPQDFLSSLTDDQLRELALAAAPEAPAAETPAAEPTAMADPPADRDQLISEIVAAGNGQYTAEQLAQMPDDQLKALWQQLKGGGDDGGTTNMSEKVKPAVRPKGEPARREPATVNFAELQEELARDRQDRERYRRERERDRQLDRARAVATFAELVDTRCRQLVAEGWRTPACVGTAKQPGPVRKALLDLGPDSAVHLFSEDGKTRLDRAVEATKILDPRTGKPMFAHLFGEKIGGTTDGQDAAAGPAALSPERRQQLLSATTLGRTMLAAESRKT